MAGGRWGMGAAAGDVDGDGDTDLLVTEWGADRLFLNEGGAGFREAKDCGLSGERWGTSAAFLDFDADGALDLVVVNYLAFDTERVAPKGALGCKWKGRAVMCGPEGLVPVHDQLYRGKGDGTFEEVSVEAGFRPRAAAFALGVVTCDYDGDGDTDLYVANDSTPNHLWENQGDGTFRESGFRRGVAHDANGREQAGMGIAVGDATGDGRPDLFVTNFSGEANAFYASTGEHSFRERAAPLGLGGPGLARLGWGTGFGDLDLDGDLDLFVLNGHVYPEADLPGTDTTYAQADQVFWNEGARFREQPLAPGPPRVSRAGALGDLDRDGDLDLVALAVEGGVRVLLNPTRGRATGDAAPHWLGIRPRARAGRTALGTTVEVAFSGGTVRREVTGAGGFQAGIPAELCFGLGEATGVERVTVHWPDGETQVLDGLPIDRWNEVVQP